MAANIPSYGLALQRYKRDYWTWLIERAGGSVSLAAKLAGVNRTHAYKLVAQLSVPFKRNENFKRGNWGNLSNEEPPPRYSPPGRLSGRQTGR